MQDYPYPLIAKPSNSAQFQDADIPRKRKIYEIESAEELAQVWRDIRTSDYDNELVLQDFIPGGDDAIRTASHHSPDASGEVRVVSGGVVCLQDHDPTALGNPLCIMGEREPEIIACAKRFLKRTGYRGFANFDIKLDERDGSFRFFEVNTRCGRNTYYMSLGGQNFVELIVREFLLGGPSTTGRRTIVRLAACRAACWMLAWRTARLQSPRDAAAPRATVALRARLVHAQRLGEGDAREPDPQVQALLLGHRRQAAEVTNHAERRRADEDESLG